MMYTKAGPLALRPVTASICFSSRISVGRFHRKFSAPARHVLAVACLPGAIAVIPFLMKHGVFGMVRITGTACERICSMNWIVTLAATEIRTCSGVKSSETVGAHPPRSAA